MSGSFNDRPTITKPGLPIGTFWGYVVEGFDNDGNFIFQDNNGSVNGVLTGKPDGKIDENDKTDIGNPHPDFTYGLNINEQGFLFQRIMRRHHEPYLIQTFVFTKIIGKSQMPDMYRVERTAEDTYIHLTNL